MSELRFGAKDAEGDPWPLMFKRGLERRTPKAIRSPKCSTRVRGGHEVFDIRVDPTHAIIEFIVDGPVSEGDAAELLGKLDAAKSALLGREIRIKADIRGRDHAVAVIGPMVRTLHSFAKQSGVQRLAEIVESDVVALELNRAAKELGTDKILRRFWEDDSANEWLIYGDLSPSSIGARWR